MNQKIFKPSLAIAGLVFIAAGCNQQLPPASNNSTNSTDPTAVVYLANKNVTAEVAESALQQSIGLSKYDSLPDDRGMIFPIDPIRKPSFWMKDMKFPIDIVWIRNGKVADLSLYVPVEPEKALADLTVFSPKVEVDTVLELSAGWATKNNLKVGDTVLIQYRPK